MASLNTNDHLHKSMLLSIQSDICWVYEFKINKLGSPLIYVMHLVVQEFFWIPFMTYGGTFVSIAQAIIICIVTINICRPFPVTMPHGKTYFVLCLDDVPSVDNLQNLALRSDVPDAWRILKAKWELQSGGLEEPDELSLGGIEVGNLTSTSALPSGITPFKVFCSHKSDILHLHVWGTCCFVMVMGYPPGKCGYCNIPDGNFLHFVFTLMHDYSTFPFLGWCNSHTPAVTPLPRNSLTWRTCLHALCHLLRFLFSLCCCLPPATPNATRTHL